MIELSNERIQKILHEETAKKEDLDTILRSVYTRYMRLYEKYFADLDALNDDSVAELRKYHEETQSLVRVYYMDIPVDICAGLKEFENQYSDKLLGPEWHEYLLDNYEDFKAYSRIRDKSDEYYKAEFKKQAMDVFYDSMDYIFRDGFDTDSQTTRKVVNGLTGLLFGVDTKKRSKLW